MKKDEVPTIVEKQEPQAQEIEFTHNLVGADNEDVFLLSREKRAAIPLLPFKEVFLPYSNKTVKFRKPITRDVKAVSNISNQELKTYQMISNLTGIDMNELESLEYRDFRVLNDVLESFL